MSSPTNQAEEEQSHESPLPVSNITPDDVIQPDSPIAEESYSNDSNQGSLEQCSNTDEVGPVSPSEDQSRDSESQRLAFNTNSTEPISQDDMNNHQWLQRTPSSSDEIDEENESNSAEREHSVDDAKSSIEAPVIREDDEEYAEMDDPSSPFPRTTVPGLDFGEEESASADYVPGLGSPTKAPQESKGMYAFLSTGQDEEIEEETEVPSQESIPFLGDDSVPSPGVEVEQVTTDATPEQEQEEEQEAEETNDESEAAVTMDIQVLNEVQEEIVNHVETQIENEVPVNVEAQMDVVEQIVETSEVPGINDTEVITTPNEVAPVDCVVKEVEQSEENVETKVSEEEAPKSPQQIVEEVYLTTDGGAKNEESGEESDFEGFEASEAAPKPSRKRRARVIDEDEEEEEGEESDFDGFEPEESKKGDRQGLIADIFDIFGHSDDEGEFDGFAETEVPPAGQEVSAEGDIVEAEKDADKEEEGSSEEKKKKKKDGDSSSSSSEDEGVSDQPPSMSHLSDFEAMMMRKKEENRRRRRRRGDNIDNINVNDDLVVALISDMKMAASVSLINFHSVCVRCLISF